MAFPATVGSIVDLRETGRALHRCSWLRNPKTFSSRRKTIYSNRHKVVSDFGPIGPQLFRNDILSTDALVPTRKQVFQGFLAGPLLASSFRPYALMLNASPALGSNDCLAEFFQGVN